jgi:hypothetical protein
MSEMRQRSRIDGLETAAGKHSGWLVPLGMLAAIAGLCVLMLLYYLAPSPNALIEEHTSPSARTDPVRLKLGRLTLVVPAKSLPYASERSGGPRREVALYAELPAFRGYTDLAAAEFSGNAPGSPMVHILITREEFDVGETARLKRIYLNEVADTRGQATDWGLTKYAFRDGSGYRGEDLFVGRDAHGDVVMRCTQPEADVPSPNCMREARFAPGILLSYRFKRSHLPQWRLIARGVERLVSSFSAASK